MIIWLLYLTICAFVALDVYQTNWLFHFGAEEANPLMLLFMENSRDIKTIIVIKVITLLILSVVLFIYQNKRGWLKWKLNVRSLM